MTDLNMTKDSIFSNTNLSLEDRAAAWAAFLDPIADQAMELGITNKLHKEYCLRKDGAGDIHRWQNEYFSYILPTGQESTQCWPDPDEALAHGLHRFMLN